MNITTLGYPASVVLWIVLRRLGSLPIFFDRSLQLTFAFGGPRQAPWTMPVTSAAPSSHARVFPPFSSLLLPLMPS